MNPTRLLAHFDRISETPDAVSRLRRFVLDLAVRGRLVEQNPNDEPVAVLLNRIQAERARLVRAGEIRKRKVELSLIDSEPFEVPSGWEWVRFGCLADFSAGRTPPRHDQSFWNTGDYAWVSIADMEDGGVVETTKETVSEKARSSVFRTDPLPAGTLIMSFKLTIGKISWLGIPAFHNEAIISIRPHERDMGIYLFKILPGFSRSGETKAAIKGATLNRNTINNICIPLPPLAEQHRIVAKVDELMALCDRLEAAQAKRENRRDRLTVASLERLNESATSKHGADGTAFREHARFHLRHLSCFTARPNQIQQLRQAVRNLAVRGRLVPQDPTDEPAVDLVARIRAERNDLMKRGELKAPRSTSVVPEEEFPFTLPASWQWVPLRDLIVFGPRNGVSPRASSRSDAPKSITLTATTSGAFDSRHFKRVEASVPPDSEFWLRPGDLLFQRGNTRDYVGIAASYNGPAGVFLYPDLMMKVRVSKEVELAYVHLCAVAPHARAYLSAHASGAQATMPKINQTILNRLPIALPPVMEQRRILAKVEQLMALCDGVEAQLMVARTEGSRLLEALVQEAVALGTTEAASRLGGHPASAEEAHP